MSIVKVFPDRYKYVYQSAVVFGATLFYLAGTLSIAWSSPSLPKLLAPGGPILITVLQGTWILSAMRCALIVVPIPAAWIMERIGPKKALLIGAFPLLAGWIILALAETAVLLIVFGFLVGTALSFAEVVLPMYIAEISTAHIRGYLGVLFTVMGNTGLLLMYAIGPFVSVRMMAYLSAIPCILFFVISYWLPESPYHLIAKKREAKAEINLQQLRCSHDVKDELAQMELSVKESQDNQGTFRELFFHSRNRRSIIVVLGLSALAEMSGSQIILHYAETIFTAMDTGLDNKYASIMFGVVQLFAAILACFLVDTLGRRRLLLSSMIGSGCCSMVIAIYYIVGRHIDVTGFGWLPLTAIMVYMVTYSSGMEPLMYVISSELFPKHLRAVAGATLAINGNCIGLLMINGYQYVLSVWGSDYVFMAFSLFTFAFVPLVFVLVPETKRMSLEGILNKTKTTATTQL